MSTQPTRIKVFGLGGGGSNAVNRMIELGLDGVEFLAANTDAQALRLSLAQTKLQLGPSTTRGLGAGGRPEVGALAAKESRAEIRAALAGADLVFLTAGMGGGTGTGAIAVAAEEAKALGALTVAIVTTPFSFEATRRRQNAEWGLEALRPQVDTLIVVPNDRLLPLLGRHMRFDVSLRVADEVLRQGVQGLTELIGKPGLINVDFAHVRNIMQNGGNAMMAIGQGRGENKAEQAVQQALKMPLLDIPNLHNARGVLVHFTGGDDLGLFEISRAAEQLQRAAPEADIVFGAAIDATMAGRAQVILIVTGYDLPSAAPEPLIPHDAIPASPAVLAPVTASAKTAFSADIPEPSAEPAGQLANALFSRAVAAGAGAVAEETVVVTEPPAANPNSLDIPAFLRRRRTLRDIERA
jgi:cell division protein FtsZ